MCTTEDQTRCRMKENGCDKKSRESSEELDLVNEHQSRKKEGSQSQMSLVEHKNIECPSYFLLKPTNVASKKAIKMTGDTVDRLNCMILPLSQVSFVYIFGIVIIITRRDGRINGFAYHFDPNVVFAVYSAKTGQLFLLNGKFTKVVLICTSSEIMENFLKLPDPLLQFPSRFCIQLGWNISMETIRSTTKSDVPSMKLCSGSSYDLSNTYDFEDCIMFYNDHAMELCFVIILDPVCWPIIIDWNITVTPIIYFIECTNFKNVTHAAIIHERTSRLFNKSYTERCCGRPLKNGELINENNALKLKVNQLEIINRRLKNEKQLLEKEILDLNEIHKIMRGELEQKVQKQNEFISKMKEDFEEKFDHLQRKNLLLQNEMLALRDSQANLKREHDDMLLEFGKVSFERSMETSKTVTKEMFQKLFSGKATITGDQKGISNTPCGPSVSLKCEDNPTTSLFSTLSPPCIQENHISAVTQREPEIVRLQQSELVDRNNANFSAESLPFSVQPEEEFEPINLSTEPTSCASATVLNTYKLLLLTMSQRLLTSDIARLKIWAKEMFSVETNQGAAEVLLLLDKKGAINSLNLMRLREFFESLLRFDLVHLIDQFNCGDYDSVRKLISSSQPQKGRISNLSDLSRPNTGADRSVTRLPVDENPNNTQLSATASRIPGGNNTTRRDGIQNNGDMVSSSDNSVVVQQTVNKEQESNLQQRNTMSDVYSALSGGSNGPTLRKTTSQIKSNLRSKCTENCHAANDGHAHNPSNANDDKDQWLCTHYKRRCYVKFECCDKYWPCHRCHNNARTCGNKKLKSRDTTMVKCVACQTEQQFGENGQFCVACNIQFADFYCAQCKHLTGMDDYPYHCDKCGICRIHGDKSFHCDVCGVCLDVQLRENHKCRPDSAHDECGICLEDAFSGCQILPCSHKVHKSCATQMIQRGITKCPICRESFAHKLQRSTGTKRGKRRR